MTVEVRISSVEKGDRLEWSGVAIEVRRVAADGSWADVRCVPPDGKPWTKRQKLPLPAGTVRVTT